MMIVRTKRYQKHQPAQQRLIKKLRRTRSKERDLQLGRVLVNAIRQKQFNKQCKRSPVLRPHY
jgi:hypothetical protein